VLDPVFSIVRSGGRIALGGVFPGTAEIDLKQIVNTGRTVIGLVAHNPVHFETALKMLADGRVNVKPIITKAVDLENIIPEGFTDYLENKGKYVKLLAKV
jgi:(R,R)-butanediol dehydrogenase/meso-butanediol dehydrogenase/diacetyl reductase